MDKKKTRDKSIDKERITTIQQLASPEIPESMIRFFIVQQYDLASAQDAIKEFLEVAHWGMESSHWGEPKREKEK